MLIPHQGIRGRVKPLGVPSIDWKHPISNGLVRYAWEDAGNVIDLVDRVPYVRTTMSSRPTAFGTGMYGSGSGGSNATYNDTGSDLPRLYTTSFTAMVGCFRQGSSAAYHGPAGQSANGGISPPYNQYSISFNPASAGASVVRVYFAGTGGTQFNTTDGTVNDNTMNIITVTGNAGAVTLWINGISSGGGAAYVPYTSAGDSAFNISADGFAGYVFFHCKWARELSSPEIVSLSNDPYQFLITPDADLYSLYLPVSSGVSHNRMLTGVGG